MLSWNQRIGNQTLKHDELRNHVSNLRNVLDSILQEAYLDDINRIIDAVSNSFKNGGKVLIFGNGGSSMDAGHIAAEFTGRYKTERVGYPAMALSDSAATMTAIANDFGYVNIFSRQIQAFAQKWDTAIGLSTSGKSENVLAGLREAKRQGLNSILISGNSCSILEDCDLHLRIPSPNTAHIQETTIFIGHIIAEQVELNLNA